MEVHQPGQTGVEAQFREGGILDDLYPVALGQLEQAISIRQAQLATQRVVAIR